MQAQPHIPSLDELETFAEFSARRENISKNQLEWLYRNKSTNGLSSAFCKIGKRRYVIPSRLATLLTSSN